VESIWKAGGRSVFELEAAGRYRLARAPLVQALAQVRFPLVAHLQTLPGVAPVQDRLRDLFPYMAQQHVQEFALQIGPAVSAPPEMETSVTWEFTDDDGRLLVLAAGNATLSVGEQYEGIEDFAARFREVLAALGAVEGLRRCDRLGVRYLSLAQPPPGDDDAWARWFRPELTGWAASGIIAPDAIVNGSITQTQITSPPSSDFAVCPGDVGAIIRHGFVGAGAAIPGVPPIVTAQPTYLVDLDLFVAVPQQFDLDALVAQFLALHGQIDRFFKWTLTGEGLAFFGYEDI
jgi:uncharacterized protein (TIGR04255 family)